MLRQSAFTGDRPLLKGALHCHTTRSDGKGTPEEVQNNEVVIKAYLGVSEDE